jgi:aspartyl-tRNA(Asn)/glutamyl-tRNA(Gln) amidotransferase subunit A
MMSERSAVERVSEALERAHRSQPSLNAFTSIEDERALDRASEIDRRIEAGENPGPLAGTPIGLKDLIDHEGRVTTAGSAFYRKRPDRSAPCVAALESAGAVIIGRTGLHEWAFGFSSENPHWGAVRNPWDTDSSTGGSSGGSAAAVAAGIVPIAIGTDTGGSVRVPSALCGTYGLKVTYGRIPLDGVFPLVGSIDTVGPLADSIENLGLSYRAMSGDRAPEPETRSLRLGIPQPWVGDAPHDPDIASAFESLAGSLRDLGHQVGSIQMPDVVPAPPMWHAIAPEAREVHAGFRARGEPYGADIAQRLHDAEEVTDEEIEESGRWQKMIRTRFADALETVDLLITPAVPVRKKMIGVDEIAGRHYRSVLSYFSALVNHALLPALALPIAGTGSPPASLQVIGAPNAEADLLGFGRHLEGQELVEFEIPLPKFT